jgi:hypothetical protein
MSHPHIDNTSVVGSRLQAAELIATAGVPTLAEVGKQKGLRGLRDHYEREIVMKNTTTSNNESRRFLAFYGFLDPGNSVTQELTEPRASIEAVISDVADRQEGEGKICFVQIVDLANLKPVEPCQTTLARLHRAVRGL